MDPCTRQDPLLLETTSAPLTLCGCWICAFCVDRTWREYSRYLTTTHETFKILSFLDRYRQQVSKIHHDASYLLFQIKHLSMGIKKHFCSRPVPSLLAIQWIHQAPPSCTLSSAWRREPGHYRSPQNPHWSKQWSERSGLQLHMTAMENQRIPCLSETPAHGLRVPEMPWQRPTVTNLGREDTGKSRSSFKEHIAILSRGTTNNRALHRGDRNQE